MAHKSKPKQKRDLNQITAMAKPNEDQTVGMARTAMRPTVQGAVILPAPRRRAISVERKQCLRHKLIRLMPSSATCPAGLHSTWASTRRLLRHTRKSARRLWRPWRRSSTLGPLLSSSQANIAHGHQQVNNAPSRADEIEDPQNKLLEQTDGERLDTGTTSTAGGADTPMEAVGAVHRAKNRRR